MEDKTQQPITTVPFTELALRSSEQDSSTPLRLRFLQASSELSASVINDSLESSIEEGIDISLSGSQNAHTGQDLMTQHMKRTANKIVPSSLKWSSESSAFFRPIIPGRGHGEGEVEGGSWQTDEEKSKYLVKPTPSILVNDSEVRLSPLTPPTNGDDPTHGYSALQSGMHLRTFYRTNMLGMLLLLLLLIQNQVLIAFVVEEVWSEMFSIARLPRPLVGPGVNPLSSYRNSSR